MMGRPISKCWSAYKEKFRVGTSVRISWCLCMGLLQRLRFNWSPRLFKGFPSRAVVEAYLKPEVNESRAKFTWLAPDEDTLRDHLSQKIGWNRDKFNAVVVPVLSNYNAPDSQRRIDSFFSAIRFPDRTAVGVSKRVLNAIRKADFGSTEEKEDVEVTAPSSQPTPGDYRLVLVCFE